MMTLIPEGFKISQRNVEKHRVTLFDSDGLSALTPYALGKGLGTQRSARSLAIVRGSGCPGQGP